MQRHKMPIQAALGLIFFILLMDVVGMSILYPVAPYIVRRYSSHALMLTVLTAIYATAQFFAAPVLGKCGDRYGRRPVLLVSLFGSAIGYILFGIGGALWVLFLSRLIDGITAGNQSTAAAYIADVSTPEARAKHFTLIGMAWGLGLIVGPALGAAFGQISLAAPAVIAAVLSLLSALLNVVLLPESLPRDRRETTPLRLGDLNPFLSIGEMARKPGLGWLLLVLCLFNFAFNGINSTETLFLIEKFATQPWQLGVLLVLAGSTIVLVQRLVQPLVQHYGEQGIAIIGLVGQSLGALATFVAPTVWLVYPLTMFRTITSGLIFPTLGALMTSRVSPREQGMLMGVTTALSSLMSILGPLWAGAVYDRMMPGAPYWMGSGVFVLAALTLTYAPVWRCVCRST
ncbi:MAG TPA: MFS transporter [Roseiflexaceae bacterium]|nr:MFS transporter [Roseiflexaceae bacterium]